MKAKRTRLLLRGNPRRGSVTVFLVVAFACFITVTAVLFAAAKSVAGRSMADASLQLAGRSVLSEYDTRLLSDYGLLAFRGDEARIEDQIAYFTDASLAAKDPLYVLFRGGANRTIAQNTACRDIEVNLKEYSLLDLDNFENQIRATSIYTVTGSLLGGSGGKKSDDGDGKGHVLRKNSVISSLPSYGYRTPLFPSLSGIADFISSGDMLQAGAAILQTSEYALSVFGNRVDGAKEDHFFDNEIEYILVGKYDDEANYSSIKIRLDFIRFLLNNVALLTDSSKMASVDEIALAASAISGESLYPVIRIAVIEAWVSAETRNDIMLLEKGENVAFLKNASQWATQNIGEIWEGWTASEPVHAANRDGQSYRDYLRVMLYFLDRETKLLRMMDLMQINLKGTYHGDFLMREQYVGFRFACNVSGDRYAYTEKY